MIKNIELMVSSRKQTEPVHYKELSFKNLEFKIADMVK